MSRRSPASTSTSRRGEFFSLLGPSGSGKTTTLRMIAGFELPTAGRVLLDGRDVSRLPPYERDVNTVFQDYALFPHMTVADNVGYGLMIRKVPQGRAQASRAPRRSRMVRLEGYEDRKPGQLSGGQRQRVALARALVNRPRVLLLDEPLGALDLKLRQEMQIELKAIQQQVGITFIYVTHDQDEALAMSDRIAIFDRRPHRAGGYARPRSTSDPRPPSWPASWAPRTCSRATVAAAGRWAARAPSPCAPRRSTSSAAGAPCPRARWPSTAPCATSSISARIPATTWRSTLGGELEVIKQNVTTSSMEVLALKGTARPTRLGPPAHAAHRRRIGAGRQPGTRSMIPASPVDRRIGGGCSWITADVAQGAARRGPRAGARPDARGGRGTVARGQLPGPRGRPDRARRAGEGALNVIAWAGLRRGRQQRPRRSTGSAASRRRPAARSTSRSATRRTRCSRSCRPATTTWCPRRVTPRTGSSRAGAVQPINLNLIPNYADVFEGLKDQPHNTVDGVPYGVPHGRGANLLHVQHRGRDAGAGQLVDRRCSTPPSPYARQGHRLRQPHLHRRRGGLPDGHAARAGHHQPVRARRDPVRRRPSTCSSTQRAIIGRYWGLYTDEIAALPVRRQRRWARPGRSPPTCSRTAEPPTPVEVVLPKEGSTGWSDTWMLSSAGASIPTAATCS